MRSYRKTLEFHTHFFRYTLYLPISYMYYQYISAYMPPCTYYMRCMVYIIFIRYFFYSLYKLTVENSLLRIYDTTTYVSSTSYIRIRFVKKKIHVYYFTYMYSVSRIYDHMYFYQRITEMKKKMPYHPVITQALSPFN